MSDRTSDAKPLRFLTILDEHTRECLAIDVGRRLRSEDVLNHLTELFLLKGVLERGIQSGSTTQFVGLQASGSRNAFPGAAVGGGY